MTSRNPGERVLTQNDSAAHALDLRSLSKTFGSGSHAVRAVSGIDLSVKRGQVFGFLGANGAGKSTTIRMIVDLVRPSHGEIRIFGEDWQQSEVLRRVGSLVESALFYPHLSGRRNLEVLARTRGVYNAEQIDDLLGRLDMTQRAGRPVAGYSMGMKQRLGVAAALLGDPELVILDEPTNGLDPAGIREMRSFIRYLVEQRGLTIFLSSHLLSEVEQTCDEVAILSRGEIVRQGKVADLLTADSALRVSAAPLELAESILSRDWSVVRQADWLRVAAPPERAPEVVRCLVLAELEVFEVRPEKRTLESYFLEVTSASDGDLPGASS